MRKQNSFAWSESNRGCESENKIGRVAKAGSMKDSAENQIRGTWATLTTNTSAIGGVGGGRKRGWRGLMIVRHSSEFIPIMGADFLAAGDWPQDRPHKGRHDPYAGGRSWDASQDSPSMPFHGNRHGFSTGPPPGFREPPLVPDFEFPSMQRHGRRRQPSGMQYHQQDLDSAMDSPEMHETHMPASWTRRPNAQRRQSARHHQRRAGMGSPIGSCAGRSHVSGSRSGRGSSFHGPEPEAGAPEYTREPRGRQGEGGR